MSDPPLPENQNKSCESTVIEACRYCLVFDSIADAAKELYPERPWGPGNNPQTAVHEFLSSHPEFTIDSTIPDKQLITVAPDGYLRRASN